jgi:UDP-galactopyranose mutase
MDYDYIIVGAGLFGAICARELTDFGKKCLVVEKRRHIGGNIYTEKIEGINIHKYGAHIFHTNDEFIWNYVNKYAVFNNFINSPLAFYRGKLYNLPFNMNTFYQLWGCIEPSSAQKIIEFQRNKYSVNNPQNLEEHAISLVGKDIYELLIKGYTEKQWGRSARDLPKFIINRIPIRFTFDNNYFNDKFQGIPQNGYTELIQNLLKGIEVKTDVDYQRNRFYFEKLSYNTIFTGSLDEYFNFEFGSLEYRGLEFKEEILPVNNFQGNAVVNYTDISVPYTRIIEHKHFEIQKIKKNISVISKEFPIEWKQNMIQYYPINDKKNNQVHNEYIKKANSIPNFYFGGRLAAYRYYDMHQVVAASLKLVSILKNNEN